MKQQNHAEPGEKGGIGLPDLPRKFTDMFSCEWCCMIAALFCFCLAGLALAGCGRPMDGNIYLEAREGSALERMVIKPVMISEQPDGGGYKRFNFTLSFENPTDQWIYFDANAHHSPLITAEGYEYSLTDQCEGLIAGAPYTLISGWSMLPPGFRVESGDISCRVGENTQVTGLMLLSKAQYLFNDALNDPTDMSRWTEVAVPLNRTYPTGKFPFIDPEGWEGYRRTTQGSVLVLQPGEIVSTPFADLAFDGIMEEWGNCDDFYLVMRVMNTSPAYELQLQYYAQAITQYENVYGDVEGETLLGPLQQETLKLGGSLRVAGKITNPVGDWTCDMPKSDLLCLFGEELDYSLNHEVLQEYPFPHVICFDTTGLDDDILN